MDILNGQTATLDVELKIVDEANSTNTTVYSNDFDGNEILQTVLHVHGPTMSM